MTTDLPTSPRGIPCPDCRAPRFTACKRVKPGRKVEIQYLKGFHAGREADFKRLLADAATAMGE